MDKNKNINDYLNNNDNINNVIIDDDINITNKSTKNNESIKKNKSTKNNDSIKNNESIKKNDSIKNNKSTKNNNIMLKDIHSEQYCNKTSSSSIEDKKIYKSIEDKNIFFTELLKKQLSDIPSDKKLSYNDIRRISKFLNSSIFDKKKCSIWNGYITNENNVIKGTYINFYFNQKKIALHRLLYLNYVGNLSDNEYLKYNCENKGKCCNINHMNKYTYNNNLTTSNELSNIKKCNNDINNNNDISEQIQINVDKKKLIIEL